MQRLIGWLFSPLAFAVGFLWPLCAQILLAADLAASVPEGYLIGGAIAIGWGLMAQLRGSWIWLK